MARVTLSSEDVAPGVLPSSCLVCGAAAGTAVRPTLSWVPGWAYLTLICGFWPFVIVYLIVRRAMTVNALVCRRHRNHFRWRQWLLPAGLLATLAVLFAPMFIEPDARDLPSWSLIGAAALFAGTIVAAVWLRLTGVRALVVTRDEITLTGVAPGFVSAVEVGRAEYEERRQAWVARRDHK